MDSIPSVMYFIRKYDLDTLFKTSLIQTISLNSELNLRFTHSMDQIRKTHVL